MTASADVVIQSLDRFHPFHPVNSNNCSGSHLDQEFFCMAKESDPPTQCVCKAWSPAQTAMPIGLHAPPIRRRQSPTTRGAASQKWRRNRSLRPGPDARRGILDPERNGHKDVFFGRNSPHLIPPLIGAFCPNGQSTFAL